MKTGALLVLLVLVLAWVPFSYGAEVGGSQASSLTSAQKWWAPFSVGVAVAGLVTVVLLAIGSITLPWVGLVVITVRIALAAGAIAGLVGGSVTYYKLQEPQRTKEKQSPYRTDFFKKEPASSTPVPPIENILIPGGNGGPFVSCEQERDDCKKLCAPSSTAFFGQGGRTEDDKARCLDLCDKEYNECKSAS